MATVRRSKLHKPLAADTLCPRGRGGAALDAALAAAAADHAGSNPQQPGRHMVVHMV